MYCMACAARVRGARACGGEAVWRCGAGGRGASERFDGERVRVYDGVDCGVPVERSAGGCAVYNPRGREWEFATVQSVRELIRNRVLEYLSKGGLQVLRGVSHSGRHTPP